MRILQGRTMNKQSADIIVYRPAGGAGLHKAGAFGWAVNRITVDEELSARTEPGVRTAVA